MAKPDYMAQTGISVANLLSALTRNLRDVYRPERHYMRGPGPKWHEKHAGETPPALCPAPGAAASRPRPPASAA